MLKILSNGATAIVTRRQVTYFSRKMHQGMHANVNAKAHASADARSDMKHQSLFAS